MTIYVLDPSGRATGEIIENRGMEWYQATGFIPRHLTDVPPLSPKDGFDVVFNGSGWEYFAVDLVEQP